MSKKHGKREKEIFYISDASVQAYDNGKKKLKKQKRKPYYTREEKRNRRRRRAIKGMIVAGILMLFMIAACVGLVYATHYVNSFRPAAEETVATLDFTAYSNKYASRIYYKNKVSGEWEVLETLRQGADIEWIPYEEFPKNLVNAAIAIEDKRFWEHEGVDWKRTINAAYHFVLKKDMDGGGGSTITQQLLKTLSGNTEVTKERKIQEILEALELEQKYSKEQIMELYLNNIYYGNNSLGVYRAAKKYFDKSVSDLSLIESALLMSTVNNPAKYDPYNNPNNAKGRAALIISQMYDQELITHQEADDALAEIGYTMEIQENKKLFNTEITYVLTHDEAKDTFELVDGTLDEVVTEEEANHIYSWYVDAVISKALEEIMQLYDCDINKANEILYKGGLNIYCFIDTDVQANVDAVFSDRWANWVNQAWDDEYPPQSAISVIDNKNGACVALSGGLGEKTENRVWNRAIDTVRPTGSSIKPLTVYGPAFDLHLVTPNTVIEDSKFKDDEYGRPWPVNADGIYSGNTTVQTAIMRSINTVAVKVLDKVGVDTSFSYLKDRFHITSLVDADRDYAPLALGGFTYGISTYEMAAAFSVFPREGVYIEPYLYSQITDREGNILIEHGTEAEQALSVEAAHVTTDMLHLAVEGGTGYNARLWSQEAAGKTGTTSNSYDLWFCGFTPYYTAAVWSGYDTQKAMGNSVSNPSLFLWKAVMDRIHEDKEWKPLY